MAEKQFLSRFVGNNSKSESPPESAPLGGNREEAMQRLQVGLFGIGAMILLVGLASVIGNQAQLTEANAVPDAAPTTEPTDALPQRDPLADAGVVPDIPAEPSPTPSGDEPILPEQGAENPAGPPDDTPAQ
ncbi:hypothetical protein [Erythrobacter sp. F6033]|uniref:hypothetical protein n=1 Tax=Erythrobacter sp. F6033 TaxID=2926401 RepID=UPI001FF21106|nr:hypothetical protein [Erythrobacter sp. F6033]MCK0129024.1 hypothetical protein [Erythrobacter sp. F6033]